VRDGVEGGLTAIAQIEVLQDVGNVLLCGAFADGNLLRARMEYLMMFVPKLAIIGRSCHGLNIYALQATVLERHCSNLILKQPMSWSSYNRHWSLAKQGQWLQA
jgi:hypothetical protein